MASKNVQEVIVFIAIILILSGIMIVTYEILGTFFTPQAPIITCYNTINHNPVVCPPGLNNTYGLPGIVTVLPNGSILTNWSDFNGFT